MENIEMYQGDTKRVSFTVTIDDEPYIPELEDRIFFTVKNMDYDPLNALIKKSYPENINFIEDTNEFELTIESSESEKLCPGTYQFDIKFKFVGINEVDKTGIVGNLIINSNVTRRVDEI